MQRSVQHTVTVLVGAMLDDARLVGYDKMPSSRSLATYNGSMSFAVRAWSSGNLRLTSESADVPEHFMPTDSSFRRPLRERSAKAVIWSVVFAIMLFEILNDCPYVICNDDEGNGEDADGDDVTRRCADAFEFDVVHAAHAHLRGPLHAPEEVRVIVFGVEVVSVDAECWIGVVVVFHVIVCL